MEKRLIFGEIFLLGLVSLEEIFSQALFDIGMPLSSLRGLMFLLLIPIKTFGLIKQTYDEFG